MTNMTAKQYLESAYRLNELISNDISELERLRDLCKSISSPNLSGVHSGSRKNEAPFTKTVEKIVDLEETINTEIDSFIDLKKELRDVINSVENPNEKLLLRLRYIEFMTWEQIAERMSYSVVQVYRIHSNALRNVKIPKR